MTIRIEGEHADLKAIHRLLYQADKKQLVEEENKATPGINSEPIVIALITAVTPFAIQALKSWTELKKAKLAGELEKAKTEAEREKTLLAYDLAKTRILIESDKMKTIAITAEEIDQLPDRLDSQKPA